MMKTLTPSRRGEEGSCWHTITSSLLWQQDAMQHKYEKPNKTVFIMASSSERMKVWGSAAGQSGDFTVYIHRVPRVFAQAWSASRTVSTSKALVMNKLYTKLKKNNKKTYLHIYTSGFSRHPFKIYFVLKRTIFMFVILSILHLLSGLCPIKCSKRFI